MLDRVETETVLINLPDPTFVEVWREVVGEVPAILADRAEMVDILLDASDLPEGAPVGPD